MSFTKLVLLAPVVLLGCTAGEIVDSNFNPYPVADGGLTFVAVDNNGKPSGARYDFPFTAGPTASSYVAFDSDAPAMHTYGSIQNVPTFIPQGRYYVRIQSANLSPGFTAESPIFDHEYGGACTDYFTHQTDAACVEYYFQIGSSCPACCLGGSCTLTPLQTKGNAKIIPFVPTH